VHESTKSEAKHPEHTKLKANTKEALTTHEEKKIIQWNFCDLRLTDTTDINTGRLNNGASSINVPRVDFEMPMASIKDASIKIKICEVKPLEH